MACKDCIHFKMCDRTDMKNCPHFMDRSRFVKGVKMATKIKVPFNQNGETLFSDNTRWGSPPYEWRDNYIFEDTLQFTGFSNMGTSVQAKFKSLTDGKSYTMILSELERCINIDVIHDGKIKGAFTFVKKGTNFSVSYVVDG